MNALKQYYDLKSSNAKKLKDSRRQYYNRKSAEWHKNDELSHLRQRDKHRMKAVIPLELPKMKAWDFVKGRVTA